MSKKIEQRQKNRWISNQSKEKEKDRVAWQIASTKMVTEEPLLIDLLTLVDTLGQTNIDNHSSNP